MRYRINNNIVVHGYSSGIEAQTVQYREISKEEHYNLLKHVHENKPVYLYNTNVLIENYATINITEYRREDYANEWEYTFEFMFFKPNLKIDDIRDFEYLLDNCSLESDDAMEYYVSKMKVKLHHLCIKPFNTKAGELLFGKK